MRSEAATVDEYLAGLSPERSESLQRLRHALRPHLDPRLAEVMQYGMITYVVPHHVYPPGYHCRPADPLPFLSLASQKNNLALYVMALWMDRPLSDWFDKAWKATGHRLDRGQSCIRFRTPDEIPWDVLAELLGKLDVPTYLQMYEQGRPTSAKKPGTQAPATNQQTAKQQPSRKKSAAPAHRGKPMPPTDSTTSATPGTKTAGSARRGKKTAANRDTPAGRGKRPAAAPKSPAARKRGNPRPPGRG